MKKLQANFKNEFPGVWRAVLGDTAEAAQTLTSFAEVHPKAERLNQFEEVPFPFEEEIIAEQVRDRVVFCTPLNEEEMIFGAGLNYKVININGMVLHLKVDHFEGWDDGRTHAPVPFYISSKGYGVFLNTAHYIDIHVGTAARLGAKKGFQNRDRNTDPNWTVSPIAEYIECSVKDTSGLEVLIFAGKNITEVVQRYNLYCGGGYIPPKWGLGIWYRPHAHYNADQVIDVMDRFSQNDFPIDVVGLEPGWQSRAYPGTFEWDPVRFPDPAGFMDKMTGSNIKVNLWENMYISPEAKIFPKMLPYACSHTVGGGIAPDFSMKEVADILSEQHERDHLSLGVSGYKIDECDGYDFWMWPDHATFPSGHTAEQMRSAYGLLLQKIMTALFRKKNQRTYSLARASNGGSSSFPFVIYNDCYDFDEFLTGVFNAGFIGVAWVPEVRRISNPYDFMRRCQLVAMSPVAMINAWSSGVEPWHFKEVIKQIRDVFQLRRRMLPYLYSAYADYCFHGVPVFRAMAMETQIEVHHSKFQLNDADDHHTLQHSVAIKAQYMMGSCIMVAPISPDKDKCTVTFPEGNWYDFYTGELAGNNSTLEFDKSYEQIPLFVKEGGIVPLLCDDGSIEVRYYGKESGSFLYFDDDGESFDYEKGNYLLVSLNVSAANGSPKLEVTTIHNGTGAQLPTFRLVAMTKGSK